MILCCVQNSEFDDQPGEVALPRLIARVLAWFIYKSVCRRRSAHMGALPVSVCLATGSTLVNFAALRQTGVGDIVLQTYPTASPIAWQMHTVDEEGRLQSHSNTE
jgi:hypothetical protein